MKFRKGKCKVLHLGMNNPLHQYGLDAHQLKSSFVVKDMGHIRKSIASRLWEVILLTI